MNSQINQFIEQHKHILILSGAGVSTDSGIPDFRGSQGIYKSQYHNLPPEMILSIDFFTEELQLVYQFIDEVLETKAALPNKAHYLAEKLDGLGKLAGVITQNIDGLYQKTHLNEKKLVEIHGNLKIVCAKCGKEYSDLANIKQTKEGHYISPCHPETILRPNIMFYGEIYQQKMIDKINHLKRIADSIIVMGTGLDIPFIRAIAFEGDEDVLILNKNTIHPPYYANAVEILGDFNKLL